MANLSTTLNHFDTLIISFLDARRRNEAMGLKDGKGGQLGLRKHGISNPGQTVERRNWLGGTSWGVGGEEHLLCWDL